MWTAGDAVHLSLRVCGGTLSWESRPWSPALCPLLYAHWSSRCDHAGPRGGSPAPLHAQVSPNFGPLSPGEGSFAWRGPLLSHEGQGKRDSVQVLCGLRSRAGVSPPWPGPFSSSASSLTAQVRGGGSRKRDSGTPGPLYSFLWRTCCGQWPRLTSLCVPSSVPGSWAQSRLTQEGSMSGSVGQTVTHSCTGNGNNVGANIVNWYTNRFFTGPPKRRCSQVLYPQGSQTCALAPRLSTRPL